MLPFKDIIATMTNVFKLRNVEMLEKEHQLIIGIIINGCRQPRSSCFDMYLSNMCMQLSELIYKENVDVSALRECDIYEIRTLLMNYTDEQLNDMMILLRISSKRFNPAEPLRNIAQRRRINIRHTLKKIIRRDAAKNNLFK